MYVYYIELHKESQKKKKTIVKLHQSSGIKLMNVEFWQIRYRDHFS